MNYLNILLSGNSKHGAKLKKQAVMYCLSSFYVTA